MPLQSRNISLPAGVGMDSKMDAKLVQPGKLLRIENGRLEETGAVRKRPGVEALSTDTVAGGSVSQGVKLAKFKDELLLRDGEKLWSWSETNEAWKAIGDLVECRVTLKELDRSAGIRSGQSLAYAGGYLFISYVQADAITGGPDFNGKGVYYSVYDPVSGVFLQRDVQVVNVGATGRRTRIVTIGPTSQYVLILHESDTNEISAHVLRSDMPESTGSDVVLASDVDTPVAIQVWDASQHETLEGVLVYQSTTSNTVKRVRFDEDGTVGSTLSETLNDVALSIGAHSDGDHVCVVTNDATDGLQVKTYDSTLSAVSSLVSIDSSTPAQNRRIAIGKVGTTFYIYWSILDHIAAHGDINTEEARFEEDGSGGVTGKQFFLRGVFPAAKPMLRDSRLFLPLMFPAAGSVAAYPPQDTGLLARDDGHIVARWAAGRSSQETGWPVSAPVSLGQDRWLYLDALVSQLDVHARTYDTTADLAQLNDTPFSLGLELVDIDFGATGGHVEHGRQCLLLAGYPHHYDGVQVTEHGFHVYPEKLAEGSSATSNGDLSDGTRGYLAVYSWVDAQGQIHRSAPSSVLQVTLSGGGSSQRVTIDVPTLRLTAKERVQVQLYRTIDGGSGYYLLRSLDNDKTADVISWDDGLSDDDLLSSPQLYTDGGVLDHVAPPPAVAAAVHGNRVFLITGDEEVRYSKEWVEGEGLGFNEGLRIILPDDGGRASALASIGGQLAVLRESSIVGIAGAGPNDLGQGGFTAPQTIVRNVGARYASPVAHVPGGGVVFSSGNGIWSLSRALQASYVGAQVEEWNSYTVLAAVRESQANRIRLLLSDDQPTLVRDTYRNEWLLWDSPLTGAVDAIEQGGAYHWLKSDGTVYVENTALVQDDSQDYNLTIKFPWVKVSGLTGFQRVWWVKVLGEYVSAHTLRLKLYYDYDESNPTTVNRIVTSITPYLFRHKPAKQRCVAIRADVTILPTTGEGARITALDFEVAVKRKTALGAVHRI